MSRRNERHSNTGGTYDKYRIYGKALPIAPLKIIALKSCEPLAKKVDNYIVSFRKESLHDFLDPAIFSSYEADTYLTEHNCPRFGTGEAKAVIGESVRGKDLFIMVDVCNYSLTYTVNGHLNHMSPEIGRASCRERV